MSRRKDFIDSLLAGASRLHRAAATQSPHQIGDLLERGADPNGRNWRGETPLHRAAIRNPDLEVSRALIDAGADVNAHDERGATPLHRAAVAASPARTDLLIQAGADAGARDNTGATPLHHAAEGGHQETMVRLIEAGADVNAQDQAGRTPLHVAVEKGWSDSTQALLERGADPNVPDNEGEIPLHLAYAAERQDLVNPLLEAGANLEARDQAGRVPIQHLHDPDDDGGRGEHEMEARANDDSERRDTWRLPPRLRTSPAEYERIQKEVNPADSEGRTPLHRAAGNASDIHTHRLLHQGADPDITDKEGRTPLHDAAGRLDGAETVERLLRAGANPNVSQDPDGNTPLHIAVRYDNEQSVNHLLDRGANVRVADIEGRTPLHLAASNCEPDITARLLRAGADPNVRDNAGRIPLEVAKDRRDRLDPSLRNDEAVRLLEKATTPQQENKPARGDRCAKRQAPKSITSSLPTTSSNRSSVALRRGRNTGRPAKTACLRTSRRARAIRAGMRCS